MTPLPSLLQIALLLLPLVLVAEAELEKCPTRESLVQEVCSFDHNSEAAAAFRNETRLKHNVTDKDDRYNTFAIVRLFDSNVLGTAYCRSSCSGVDRRNVRWCVRIAYPSSYTEICLSLGEDDQPVFQSTCDTSALNLEDHLSLPTREECRFSAGCLGLTNLNWLFIGAYLTCIVETDTCRDVNFVRILHIRHVHEPPSINEVSPVTAQPSEKIILSAHITSSAPSILIAWHHGGNSYDVPLNENPIHDDDVCHNHLLEQRVRSYIVPQNGKDCVSFRTFEAYLIIDYARESDAGEYELEVTAQFARPLVSRKTVNVTIIDHIAGGVEAGSDTGAGYIHHLSVTQDVVLERSSTNFNYLPYLIVGTHPNYPLKRSLLQFQDLPDTCRHITWAKMYVYFVYAHKASFMSVAQVPYISRPLEVHQVKRPWSESQATSTIRLNGYTWSQQWLALDGTDADPNDLLCEPVTINTSRPAGFIELDITVAMRNWKNGEPNYGVLLMATNENSLGRGIRFASNANSNVNQHAFVNVLCN